MMLQRADGLFTSVSRSDVDVSDAKALWQDVYCGEFGWLGVGSDPRADKYHQRSLYAVCRVNGGLPVGTLRIVHEDDPGFYITEKLGTAPISRYLSKGIEVQRLMVRKEFRDRRLPEAPFGIYGVLVKVCLYHALAVGAEWVLADCHRDIDIGPLKSMKAMGFEETGHSYRDSINDEECIVLIIETKQWISNTLRNRSRFNKYLVPDDPAIRMET